MSGGGGSEFKKDFQKPKSLVGVCGSDAVVSQGYVPLFTR